MPAIAVLAHFCEVRISEKRTYCIVVCFKSRFCKNYVITFNNQNPNHNNLNIIVVILIILTSQIIIVTLIIILNSNNGHNNKI